MALVKLARGVEKLDIYAWRPQQSRQCELLPGGAAHGAISAPDRRRAL